LGKESVMKILHPAKMEFSLIALCVLIASIAVKGGLYVFNEGTARRINSDILHAAAIDSVSDCISTAVVLISMTVSALTEYNIDGYAGLLVALFIARSGILVLKETLSKLIGQAPDEAMINEIRERILSHRNVLGIHDLDVYSFGPNKYFASVHIELDARVDVMTSHELIDEIEREFAKETNVVLTGHLDPIAVNDEEANVLRERVDAIVKKINSTFSMHDFRMVKGEKNTNLIFDVAIPFGTRLTAERIKEILEEEIALIEGNYTPVIIIEHKTF